LATIYLNLGRFAEAKRATDNVRSLGEMDWAQWLDALSKFAGGDIEAALGLLDPLRNGSDDYWRSRSLAASALWNAELGRYSHAITLLEQGVAADADSASRIREAREWQIEKLLQLAFLYWRVRELPKCREICLRALALDDSPNRAMRAGTLLARSGFASDAGAILAALGRQPGIPRVLLARERVAGEIALLEGRTVDALRHFRTAARVALPSEPRGYLARALERQGERTAALEIYQQIAAHPVRLYLGPELETDALWTGTLFDSARLSALARHPGAGSLVHRFLDFRQTADRGLPEVEEALKLIQ
jgi:tetratricopeptide (TPR) repeat protein